MTVRLIVDNRETRRTRGLDSESGLQGHPSDGVAYLGFGSAAGAKAGQKLTVIHFVRVDCLSAKPEGLFFPREVAGRIEITEIVDEQYGRAKVLTGAAKEGRLVELEQP